MTRTSSKRKSKRMGMNDEPLTLPDQFMAVGTVETAEALLKHAAGDPSVAATTSLDVRSGNQPFDDASAGHYWIGTDRLLARLKAARDVSRPAGSEKI